MDELLLELNQSSISFLEKYIAGYSEMHLNDVIEIAKKNSINAALQRNKTYRDDLNIEIKQKIRTFWMNKLQQYSIIIRNNPDWDNWIESIQELKNDMNNQFQCEWHNNFRISHSQKSLSVYLKYLTCIDIVNQNPNTICPPSCPLDRIVLKLSNYQTPLPSWGKMDKIDEYSKTINQISRNVNVNINDLWKWELKNFI